MNRCIFPSEHAGYHQDTDGVQFGDNAIARTEAVDHPTHYNMGKIEVIDFIEDQRLGFHEGNVVKYVSRAAHKGKQLEDLKKALWYLNRRIEELENGTTG